MVLEKETGKDIKLSLYRFSTNVQVPERAERPRTS
jgi:hypothetical protein